MLSHIDAAYFQRHIRNIYEKHQLLDKSPYQCEAWEQKTMAVGKTCTRVILEQLFALLSQPVGHSEVTTRDT